MRYIYTINYMVLIVLVNVLYGLIPEVIVWDKVVSPVDILIGAIYVFRDLAQREIKHYILIAMLIATALSYLLADKSIALASVSAFFAGEIIDWLIYSYTKKPLSERLLWSAVISSPIDSVIFLYLANSLNVLGFTILVFAKIIGVVAVWYYWRIRQRRLGAGLT